MMQFAEQFPDFEIVSTLSTQLSWGHIVGVLPLKTAEARLFYLGEAANRQLAIRELRRMIDRKAFERKEIANAQLTDTSTIALDTFKDPYLLDVLGLLDGFLEADLEAAVLRELGSFILELGGGFTFVARQKRMIIGGEDFHLDLLFFHRRLKRLVAVELKIGKFEAAHKGQMELYLGWLNRYERQDGENAPIGLILCAEKSREQIELLQLDQDADREPRDPTAHGGLRDVQCPRTGGTHDVRPDVALAGRMAGARRISRRPHGEGARQLRATGHRSG